MRSGISLLHSVSLDGRDAGTWGVTCVAPGFCIVLPVCEREDGGMTMMTIFTFFSLIIRL